MQRFSGPKLRQHREAIGASRELLAHKIGRSFSTVVLYERGVVAPPVSVLCRLADELGCDPADFLEDIDRAAS